MIFLSKDYTYLSVPFLLVLTISYFVFSYSSLLVLPCRVKTEVPVSRTTNMTLLSVFVKTVSLVNIVK